jgi:hypothetical protein
MSYTDAHFIPSFLRSSVLFWNSVARMDGPDRLLGHPLVCHCGGHEEQTSRSFGPSKTRSRPSPVVLFTLYYAGDQVAL